MEKILEELQSRATKERLVKNYKDYEKLLDMAIKVFNESNTNTKEVIAIVQKFYIQEINVLKHILEHPEYNQLSNNELRTLTYILLRLERQVKDIKYADQIQNSLPQNRVKTTKIEKHYTIKDFLDDLSIYWKQLDGRQKRDISMKIAGNKNMVEFTRMLNDLANQDDK